MTTNTPARFTAEEYERATDGVLILHHSYVPIILSALDLAAKEAGETTAQAAAPKAEGGWVLVPREPTEAMCRAAKWALDKARERDGKGQDPRAYTAAEKHAIRWAAMLAAAPASPPDAADRETAERIVKARDYLNNEIAPYDGYHAKLIVGLLDDLSLARQSPAQWTPRLDFAGKSSPIAVDPVFSPPTQPGFNEAIEAAAKVAERWAAGTEMAGWARSFRQLAEDIRALSRSPEEGKGAPDLPAVGPKVLPV